MKKKSLLLPIIGVSALLFSGCGPLVTSGSDVMVGGGIYPAPLLSPPLGNPYMFRPGGPLGPGFIPAPPNLGRPQRPTYNPNPGTPPNQGRPNQGRPNQPGFSTGSGGNQRVPGTGVLGNPGGNGSFGGGNPGGGPGNVNPGTPNPGVPGGSPRGPVN